jgi:HSP20 family protein
MTNIIKNRNAAPAPFGSVLDQLFPNHVNSLLDDAPWGFGAPSIAAIAPVNIRETAGAYEIELAAPGLCKTDFKLKIEGDTLSISFDQPSDQEPADNNGDRSSRQKEDKPQSRWIRREFTRPSFRRHFELAETIDREKISAHYDNGILSLVLPKKENVSQGARQININ